MPMQWATTVSSLVQAREQFFPDSLSTKRNLQHKLKPNVTCIKQPVTDRGVANSAPFDWLSQLGHIAFEFTLQLMFGA